MSIHQSREDQHLASIVGLMSLDGLAELSDAEVLAALQQVEREMDGTPELIYGEDGRSQLNLELQLLLDRQSVYRLELQRRAVD